MAQRKRSTRRKLFLSFAAGQALASSTWVMATSYSWANPGSSGTWQNSSYWASASYPSSSSDTGNIADSTANRTITYAASTSTAVGTITMTQANNFLNELDVQQTGTVTLTLSNSLTLSAAGTGTSDLFLDPVLTVGSRTGTLSAPSIAINGGGVLELSSYDNTGSVALSQVTSNVTIAGGALYSDQGVGTLNTNTDANTINGSLTMSSGTISLGTHQAGAGSNEKLQGGSAASINDRLVVVGNLSITGGTLSVNDATDILFLEGATNSIQVTGNGAINSSVNLQGLASGTQTFFSDSAISGNLDFRQLLTTVNLASVIQIGSVSGGTLSVGSMTFQAKGTGQTQTIQLESNVKSIAPNYSGNAASVTDVIDTNGFTFDATTGGATFALIGNTTGIDNIINSAGSASIGTVKAATFDLSKLANGENVGSYVNLLATGIGVSTLSASSGGSATTIDPTSTFTYAGTATGVGTLISNRTIGNLVVTSQTLDLGSAIAIGTTSTTTIASAGTLNLNGFALTTNTLTNNGGVLSGSVAGSSLAVSGTLSGTGTISAAGGIAVGTSSSGSLAPGGVGTVGTLKVASGSGALTLGSGNTSNFDVAGSSSYDTMVLNSVAVTFAGTLNLNFLNSYAPAQGTQFTIFSGLPAGETTNFSSITSNLGGYTFDFNDSSGVVTVDSVPEPASIGLVGSCALLLLRRRRRTIASAEGSRIG